MSCATPGRCAGLFAIFGDEVIPVKVGPVQAGSTTYGHRQLSSGAVALSSPGEYVRTLREHYVVADAEERRSAIWRQVQDLAGREGVQVLEDGSLLDEVVNLVEYPTAFCGQFAAEYLEMPSEVLITSMKEHQRYFPVYDPEGNLAAKFVGVRNGRVIISTMWSKATKRYWQPDCPTLNFFMMRI